MTFRFILGDTETSGFGDESGVCELAFVELDEELNILDSQYSLIDPVFPISPSASGVHGIVDADVADALTLPEFFEHIYGSQLTGEVILIAHNVPFDRRYLEPHIPNLVGTICTLRLARAYFPEAPDHKLATLKYFLNLDSGTSHRADGDVRTTVDLLRHLVEKSGKSLVELSGVTEEPIFVHKLPFGKYRGENIRDVPPDYRRWLRKQKDLDKDLKYTLAQLAKEGLDQEAA
ncbi:3'-5' exonuclease [Cupriavidus necator]